MAEEVFSWLKSLPLAPEYHPTIDEFQDPIAYIFKIEEEAANYGICKIIPPVSALPKKTIIDNLNKSLLSQSPNSSPTFTTRVQQIGFCPRKHQNPVQRSVWQSGKNYTLPQFEARAKDFEKNHLKKGSNSKKGLSALEIETLYWKAQFDKPSSVEYGNDMCISAFDRTDGGVKQGKKEIEMMTVGETEWNMRGVSRAKGSLLKFLKEEIPGVTSPMVYMGMLFSWFAWHVEDHELHSLNYMHMGAGKTWYGVPMDAAAAFEEVIRTEGYAGDISPIVTFATLGGKTTVMPPEVLLKAGIPCCRLVQNAGEFVVTFPRAYHSGFSHGFNCAEATNIATPGWLSVAQEAAIRRASIGFAPLVSHSQLLYDLALSFTSSEDTSTRNEPRSSRLKDRLKTEADGYVKQIFMQDVKKNNELLDVLTDGSPITILSENVVKSLTSYVLCLQNKESSSSGCGNPDKQQRRRKYFTYNESDMKADPSNIFACVSCGTLCYAGAAIVQPTEAAAQHLNVVDPRSFSGKLPKSASPTRGQKDLPALSLLALAYGDSSDSEEEDNRESDKINSESSKSVMITNHVIDKFEYETKVHHANTKPSFIGKGLVNSVCDEGSLRMHIFCLQHAYEIKQRLQSVGGVHMMLVCHQDYRSIHDAAKKLARELGTSEGVWTDLTYEDISEQAKAFIQLAIDDEEVTNVNQDWVVKLGVDIFYSAKLSGSLFYTKQMPYNLVIYNAFGQNDPSNDLKPKQSGGQKKIIVAGRWCGKLWMSNQVHPLLVSQDDDDQEDETDDCISSNMNVNSEGNTGKRKRELPSPPPSGSPMNGDGIVKKKTRKGKTVAHKKARQAVMDNGEKSDEGSTHVRSKVKSERARKSGTGIKSKSKEKKAHVTEASEVEGEFGCVEKAAI